MNQTKPKCWFRHYLLLLLDLKKFIFSIEPHFLPHKFSFVSATLIQLVPSYNQTVSSSHTCNNGIRIHTVCLYAWINWQKASETQFDLKSDGSVIHIKTKTKNRWLNSHHVWLKICLCDALRSVWHATYDYISINTPKDSVDGSHSFSYILLQKVHSADCKCNIERTLRLFWLIFCSQNRCCVVVLCMFIRYTRMRTWSSAPD